jgi:hypothetical protein
MLALGIAAAAGLLADAALIAYPSGIGGVSSAYRARDGDLLLISIARQALPIIDALERYRKDRGVFPNPERAREADALGSYLPSTVKVVRRGGWLAFETGGISPWTYHLLGDDGSGYTLSTKLGWDPRLVYRHSLGGGQWIFDPGDGSEGKPIALRP